MSEPSLVDSLEAIAVASVAVTNAALAQAGGDALSVEQWRAIVVLGEAEDGVRISAVARGFGVTLPATSRMLQRLVRRGLVAFDPDPRDSRATIARLTADGLSLRRAVLTERRRRLAEVAGSVDVGSEGEQAVALLATAFGNELTIPSGRSAQAARKT